jgi:hypothetical protein
MALAAVLASAAQAETLVVPPYPAAAPWKKITDHVDARGTWIEWIPADQSEDAIKDILTEQIFPAQKGTDPSGFTRDWLKRIIAGCRDSSVNGPKAATENGFAAAYAQAYCVDAKGIDADIFLKAISGKDALYVVQREFRRPTGPGEIAGQRRFPKDQEAAAKAALAAQNEANDYLVSRIKLCAKDDAANCATGPATAPPAPAADKSDVSASFGFEAGKTTEDEVRHKEGEPKMSAPGPNGMHTCTYSARGGNLIVVFLFDKNNVLVRTVAYARNSPG